MNYKTFHDDDSLQKSSAGHRSLKKPKSNRDNINYDSSKRTWTTSSLLDISNLESSNSSTYMIDHATLLEHYFTMIYLVVLWLPYIVYILHRRVVDIVIFLSKPVQSAGAMLIEILTHFFRAL